MLTKEQLIEIHNNDKLHYLIYEPTHLYDWFYYYDIIPTSKLTDIKEILKTSSTKYQWFNQYVTLRGAGGMFTYGMDMVPVTIRTVYVPSSTVFRVNRPSYICVNCHFNTIDDSSRSIQFNINTEQDYYKAINDIREFLYQYPYLPSDKDFEKYWESNKNAYIDLN